MSKATLYLIGSRIDPGETADPLDRLYTYEQVVVHWCQAVENRPTGLPAFVLTDELAEQIEAAQKTSEKLAAWIAQLGGAITADPTEFVDRSPISRLELPADYGDLPGILRDRAHERAARNRSLRRARRASARSRPGHTPAPAQHPRAQARSGGRNRGGPPVRRREATRKGKP
jgi:hypothetical protein